MYEKAVNQTRGAQKNGWGTPPPLSEPLMVHHGRTKTGAKRVSKRGFEKSR